MQEMHHQFIDQHFFISGELEKSIGIELVRLGRNIAKPNYVIGPKVSTLYALHFVLEGQVVFSQNGKEYVLGKDSMFCVFPEILYSYRIHQKYTSSPLKMIWLSFTGAKVPVLLSQIGIDHSCYGGKHMLGSKIVPLWEKIKHVATQAMNNKDIFVLQAVSTLFAELARASENPIFEQADHAHEHWLDKCLDYIHTHYHENISVADVAECVKLNRSHMTRAFAQKMKCTPYEYIQNLRLDDAHRMLTTTLLSISQIATSLGYEDANSFSRAYRKKFGHPPTHARKTQ